MLDAAGRLDGRLDDRDAPDRAALRRCLDDLAEPRVLGAVVEELLADDVGAARLRLLGEALVEVAPGGRREAIARLLAALGTERFDVLAAEQQLRLAHAADPDDGPVIDHLGWYAADRGDAPRAVALWEELEPTPGLLAELEVVAAYAERTGGPVPGRNDPCWCGSGRKFKQCHLGRPRLVPLPERVPWLLAKAGSFVQRRQGEERADVMALTTARALDPDDEDSVEEAFSDPVVTDLALAEMGWFDRFVDERGPLLPADERALADEWRRCGRTVVEVVAARPGSGLTVRDLRSGELVELRERRFSRHAADGSAWMLRIVPDGESHQIVGGVVPVRPGTEAAVLELLGRGDAVEIAAHVRATHRPARPSAETPSGPARESPGSVD